MAGDVKPYQAKQALESDMVALRAAEQNDKMELLMKLAKLSEQVKS